MTHGSLFSGIGGFDLASEWMGWENKFHCEINPFGQTILKHYWPNAESFTDITKTDFTKYANRIDILTGGFPCQPYSIAGKRKGKDDERHLWPEMLRAIREISPRWVVGENVRGLTNWNAGMVFNEVQADPEAAGYEVTPFLLPACAVNAPHRRDRIWFIAHAQREQNIRRRSGGFYTKSTKFNDERIIANASIERFKIATCTEQYSIFKSSKSFQRSEFGGAFAKMPGWTDFPTQSPIRERNDGIPGKLDGITFSKWRNESIKAYGNAVVPALVLQIFKAIEQYENI